MLEGAYSDTFHSLDCEDDDRLKLPHRRSSEIHHWCPIHLQNLPAHEDVALVWDLLTDSRRFLRLKAGWALPRRLCPPSWALATGGLPPLLVAAAVEMDIMWAALLPWVIGVASCSLFRIWLDFLAEGRLVTTLSTSPPLLLLLVGLVLTRRQEIVISIKWDLALVATSKPWNTFLAYSFS